ncbi:immunodominant staphylococcal antigen IsaB family protein, partial [Staphylococcus cohnii]
MNKVSKIMLSCGLVFSTAVGAAAIDSHQSQTQAAETPYYNYTGYTSANSEFILDQDFINAIKYGNLTINGYKITNSDAETAEMV